MPGTRPVVPLSLFQRGGTLTGGEAKRTTLREGQRAEPSARLFVRLQPDVQSFTVKEIIHTLTSTDRELCRTQASGRGLWQGVGTWELTLDHTSAHISWNACSMQKCKHMRVHIAHGPKEIASRDGPASRVGAAHLGGRAGRLHGPVRSSYSVYADEDKIFAEETHRWLASPEHRSPFRST